MPVNSVTTDINFKILLFFHCFKIHKAYSEIHINFHFTFERLNQNIINIEITLQRFNYEYLYFSVLYFNFNVI